MKLFTTISFVITSSFYFLLYKKARAPGFRTFVSAIYCSTETFSVRKEEVQNLIQDIRNVHSKKLVLER